MVGGMVQAAGVTDTTEKGGVAVNLSSDTATGATAKANSSIAIGENAVVNNSKRPGEPGGSSISIGKDSISGTYGANNIAIGTSAKSTFKGDVAIGHKSSAAGAYSTAVGDDSHASALASIALGHGANARNSYSMAIGMAADVNRDKSMAIGPWARVEARNSVALGYYSSVQKDDIKDGTAKFSNEKVKASSGVVSVGTKEYTVKSTITLDDDDNDVSTSLSIPEEKRRIINVAGGIDDNDAVNVAQLTAVANQIKGGSGNQYLSIKPGKLKKAAKATGSSSIAIGDNAQSDSNETIVIGENAEAMKYMWTQPSTGKQFEQTSARSIAIGNNSKVVDTDAVALGYGAQALYNYSVAVGGGALADKGSAIAIGGVAKVLATDAIAIGRSVKVTAEAEDGVAIGYGAHLGYDKFDDPRIADKKYINPKTELEQLQKTPTILTQYQNYGDFSSIEGGGTSEDKPSVPLDKKGNPKPEVTRGAITIGQWSAASGYNAVSIGSTSRSYGMNGVAIGASSKAFLDSTVAIGDQALATKVRSTAIGRFAMTKAKDSVAIGTWARVTDDNSISLGKYSSTERTALEKDTKAAFSDETVSKDAGVVSVGTEAYGDTFDYGRIGGNIQQTTKNIPDIKRRIVNVAGGINDNDAVNVKQLTAVAESPVYIYSGGIKNSQTGDYNDNSQVTLGANQKYTINNLRFNFTDGLTATNEVVGTGENANNVIKVGISDKYMQSIQAEVQKAVDSAVAAKQSETNAGKSADVAKTSETNAGKSADAAKTSETNAGQSAEAAKASETNAGKSAKEVKDIADALKGAGIEAGKTEDGSTGSTAVGGESSIGKDSDGSVAIGKDASVGDQSSNSTAIGNGANVKDSAKEGTAIGNGSTIGDKSSGSTAIGKDANVGTDATNSTAIGNGSKVNNGAENSTAIGTGSTVGAGATNGTAIGNDTEIAEGVDNATAIGNGAKVTGGATNSVAIGAGSVADRPNTVSVGRVVEKDGKLVEETRVITHVGNGLVAKGSTDAVNGGQLYEVAQQVGNNSQAIRDLRRDSRKGDAMNAALAALKPIAYNPAEPTQIMAGIGTYRGEQAVALGAAHYVNGRTMLNAGVAYAGSSNMMANVGVTWRVGQGEVPEDVPTDAQAVAGLNNRVKSLEGLVQEQRDYMKKQQAQVDEQKKELEAQRNQIEMQNKQMKQQQEIIDALMARLH